jgi:hypothetical protein
LIPAALTKIRAYFGGAVGGASMRWVALAGMMVIAFVMLPAEPVRPSRVAYVTYYAPGNHEAYVRAGAASVGMDPSEIDKLVLAEKSVGRLPDFKTLSVSKSGLRKAVEGRLKWLGITDELAFPMTCEEERSGDRLCKRWF